MKTLGWQLMKFNYGWEIRTPDMNGRLLGRGLTKQGALQDAISRLEGTAKNLKAELRKELA